MKILKNIYKFITKSPAVFIAFALLMILSICSALYTFNFLLSVIKNNEQALEDERTYIVEVSAPDLDSRLSKIDIKGKGISHIYCLIDNDGEAVIADYYGHRIGGDGVIIGKWFTETDLAYGAKKVVLPDYHSLSRQPDFEFTRYDIGDSYEINGVSYEAIGIGALSGLTYQIPYNSIDDISLISAVAVATESFGDENEIESLSTYLEQTLGGEVISSPDVNEKISFAEKYGQYLKEGAIIVGIMLMSVFNLAYVYTYILDTRKREIAINRISGQTISSAILTFYAEILILSTLGYIISALIVKFLILPGLSDRGFMFNDCIEISQYIMIYLIFILINSIVFLPSIINQIRKSPVEAMTDEG